MTRPPRQDRVESLEAMPYWLKSGINLVYGYDPKTRRLYLLSDQVGSYNLATIQGGAQVVFELNEFFDHAGWQKMWLQYCRLYNAPAEEQKAALGEELKGTNLQQGHARLTAYAAWKQKDAKLAARAWSEYSDGRAGYGPGQSFAARRIEAPAVLNPVDEGPGISTNSSAQWGLSGIVCLAYTRPFASG